MADVPDIPTAFGEALLEAGEQNPEVVVLDADLQDSCKTEAFYRRFPERAFDLGVAEQSLPTFAAGLALVGKVPVYNTFAVFAVGRAFDQIRQSIAYNRANVKIVGHAAGLSLGYAGPSHHALEDVALMRALPRMVVLCPINGIETRRMVHWMVEYHGPVYLRLSRATGPNILPESYQFRLGHTVGIYDGNDVTIYTSGDLVTIGIAAHKALSVDGISAAVVHVPTLKPLLPEEIENQAHRTRAAVTIEDHAVTGGLGDAVAQIYAERVGKRLTPIGIRDTFTESDDRDVLLTAYDVSVAAVITAVKRLLT